MHKSCRRVSAANSDKFLPSQCTRTHCGGSRFFSARTFPSFFLSASCTTPVFRANLVDDVRNFPSLYFGARKSPCEAPGDGAYQSSLSLYTFVVTTRDRAFQRSRSHQAHRSPEGEIMGYRLFNQVGRLDPRNGQTFKFSSSDSVQTRPALSRVSTQECFVNGRTPATIPEFTGTRRIHIVRILARGSTRKNRKIRRERPAENRRLFAAIISPVGKKTTAGLIILYNGTIASPSCKCTCKRDCPT